MTVAVFLPVYLGDAPELFDRALASVANQAGVDEPVHIYLGVDGPLTAELEGVIDHHAPALHKVIRHPVHVGPTENLNSLWRAVGDEWLIFRMDADDLSAPDRFRRQIDYMRAHPDVHILGTAIEEYNLESGERVLRRYPEDPDRMKRAITFANPIAHPTVCFRREVLQASDGYPAVRNQDLALWFASLERGFRIANLPEPLVRMSVSRDFFQRRSAMNRAWPEFVIFTRGIWRLHGPTWRVVYPLGRLLLRLVGPGIARRLYRSGLRNHFCSEHRHQTP